MAVDHQPTFSRTSLNILILVCIVLILIFGQSQQSSTEMAIPEPPKLNVTDWISDSQAQIWFSPKVSNTIAIEVHYLAGFAFNHEPFDAGASHLLVSLLNQEASIKKLPIQFQLSVDFIEVSITLSSDPLRMSEQIKAAQQLLYHPQLKQTWLDKAKLHIATPLDEMWQRTFEGHPYQGPKIGTQASLSSIHRAQLQAFHKQYLHPQNAYAAISGNITLDTAKVIMERLLPKRSTPAASQIEIASAQAQNQIEHNLALIVLDGSFEQANILAKQMMTLCYLNEIHPRNINVLNGRINNVLVIEQWQNFRQAMDLTPNSDIIRQAKRQCIKSAFDKTKNAQTLSRFLVWLNRYHLPSHFLHLQFGAIDQWQLKDWQSIKHDWLQTSD